MYHAGTGITHRDGQIVEADAAAGLRGGAGPENVESVEVESQPADVALALVDRPRVGARVGGSRGIAGVLKTRFSRGIFIKLPNIISYLDVGAVLRDGVPGRG